MKRRSNVGGQAVIEGVMMRGAKGLATAIRRPDGEIEVKFEDIKPLTKKNKIFSLPIIRGFISLIDSLIIGIKSLNYSASFFEEEGEASKFDRWLENLFKDKTNDIIMGVSLVLSLAFSVLIFFLLPTYIASIFKSLDINNTILLNVIEGIIRVTIFIAYILLISKMEDINRVFQYHGAEHKSIFCYENGEDLTPSNAMKHKRFHPRCGTNFMFLVMIVSIIVFSLTGWNSVIQRTISRIVLLPLISGITYEIIKWMGKSEGLVAKFLASPGLALQKLTTREPDESQLEVAIKALKVAEGLEKVEEPKEAEEVKLELV